MSALGRILTLVIDFKRPETDLHQFDDHGLGALCRRTVTVMMGLQYNVLHAAM